MDKETLSNYGWIVICVLVMVVMIALASPFGSFVSEAVQSTTKGLFDVNHTALESTGLIAIDDQEFDVPNMNHGSENNAGNNEFDMSSVNAVLESNDWATIQKVAKAGKAAEAGWKVGDTKTVEINGATYTATIIGINHNNETGITFMIATRNGIGEYALNDSRDNTGGWEASQMREWLNGEVYNTMSNKEYIKSTTVLTNNIGENGNEVSATTDKLFLLSPKEIGIESQMEDYWATMNGTYPGMDALNNEGSIYQWFAEGNGPSGYFWTRSAYSSGNQYFNFVSYGRLSQGYANSKNGILPAFVIG